MTPNTRLSDADMQRIFRDLDRRINAAQAFDAEEELTKQNYIEARGWYPDTDEYPGEWRKDDEFGGYMVCTLDAAYEICMREETFDA